MTRTKGEFRAERRRADDGHTTRWYRPADRAGVASLLAFKLGRSASPEWFDWKFTDDPYRSHVPTNVVESGGGIVAMQAYVPYPLLRLFGSVRDSAPVLFPLTSGLHVAGLPLDADALAAGGSRELTDAANWHPTFVDVDRD